jgi:beta-glucanase (GH16 family)
MNVMARAFLFLLAGVSALFLSPPVSAQRAWTPLPGPTVQNPSGGTYKPKITCLAVNSLKHIFVGTASHGIFRSMDFGMTWTHCATAEADQDIHCIAINRQNHVYAGGLGHAWRTTSYGQGWTQIYDDTAMVWAFAFDADTTYLAHGSNVFRYNEVTHGLDFINFFGDIRSMVINGNRRLFATWGHSIDYIDLETRQDGRKPFAGAPGTSIPTLALHGSQYIYFSSDSGVFRSPQDTAQWTRMNTGMTNTDIRALCVDRDTVYAGTFGGGVLCSTDAGGHWREINDGLCDRHVNALAAGGDHYIYAGTDSGGVFRSSTAVVRTVCTDSVWSDEFSGPRIDTTIWTFDTGGWGFGNNELQYYTERRENAWIDTINGVLVIEARKEEYQGRTYTSARLTTQGLRCMRYGCIEARASVPVVTGSWPAIWMLGGSIGIEGWPACGEIDIMEHINNSEMIHGTMHWWNDCQDRHGDSIRIDTAAWHTYRVRWTPDSIAWYVDGTQYLHRTIANGIDGTDEFHAPFFVLLNLAIGGNWPGFTIDTTRFPVRFLVDYVRVNMCDTTVAVDAPSPVPGRIRLNSVYPNPASASGFVSFDIGQPATVRVSLHDVLGREVAVLLDEYRQPGRHTVPFDASALPRGAYFCCITAGGASVRTMVVVGSKGT